MGFCQDCKCEKCKLRWRLGKGPFTAQQYLEIHGGVVEQPRNEPPEPEHVTALRVAMETAQEEFNAASVAWFKAQDAASSHRQSISTRHLDGQQLEEVYDERRRLDAAERAVEDEREKAGERLQAARARFHEADKKWRDDLRLAAYRRDCEAMEAARKEK